MTEKSPKRALVVLSGGMDSATVLYWAKHHYQTVGAISFAYGQKHQSQELSAAKTLAHDLEHYAVLDLTQAFEGFKSHLLAGQADVPDGHYTAPSMSKTVVPFRNGIMLSVAAGYAESRGYDILLIGAHAGDHAIYPDCRAPFLASMHEAVYAGTDGKVMMLAPFMTSTKDEIVKVGDSLGVPYEQTYSCYRGGVKHCGRCGTCTERHEAFALNEIPDPTEYEPA